MSRGSPILSIRVPAELLDQIDSAVRDHESRTRGEVLSRNALLVKWIRESLAKRER